MPRGRRRKGSTSQAELVQLALAGIDAQIEELQQKRSQLAGMAPASTTESRGTRKTASVKAKPGRPAKKAAVKAAVAAEEEKREVSESTRRKLKRAAKKRWAREKAEKRAAAKAARAAA